MFQFLRDTIFWFLAETTMCSVASAVDFGAQSLDANLGNVGGYGGPGEVI